MEKLACFLQEHLLRRNFRSRGLAIEEAKHEAKRDFAFIATFAIPVGVRSIHCRLFRRQ
jgi:hypothetical protein